MQILKLLSNVVYGSSIAFISTVALAAAVATVTPSVWGLHLASTDEQLKSNLASLDACVDAAKAYNLTRSYKCRASSDVTVVFEVESVPPAIPSNFSCVSVGTAATCGWDVSGEVRNYYVSSSGSEGTCNSADNNVAIVVAPLHTYTRTGLVSGKIYWFKVKADEKSAAHLASAYSVCVPAMAAPPPPPPPPPSPVDCVVSDWSAWVLVGEWSVCDATGSQSCTESHSRTVVTPASNGGAACPVLSETRAVTRACQPPPPPPPSNVSYIVDDGFENGINSKVFYPALKDGAGILAVDSTHAREGNNSLLASVVKSGTSNFRQEYRVRTSLDNTAAQGSQYMLQGFALYIDPSSTIKTQFVVWQWHTITSNSGASPVVGIRAVDDRWLFTSDSLPNEYFGPNIVKGVWHDFQFRILWRNNSTGTLELWMDGVKYLDKKNMRTTWGGENNIPWLHIGNYSSSWKQAGNPDPNGTIHKIWVDSFRQIYDNNGNVADVAPRGDRLQAK